MKNDKLYLGNARRHIQTNIEVKQALLSEGLSPVIEAAKLIAAAFKSGKKLLICGNGGSAADSQHMATEFVSRLSRDFAREALPAIALTTDTSFLTAYANDVNFSGIFARQVEALGQRGDILLGISTSGNSDNAILAIKEAKKKKLRSIALIGDGGAMESLVDICIKVPCSMTQLVQETHLSIEHIICDVVECILFEKRLIGNDGK